MMSIPFNDFAGQIVELREQLNTAIARVLDRAYFILAGSHDGQDRRVLYRWSGMKMNSPERVCVFNPSTQNPIPDTLVPFADAAELLLLGESQTSQSSDVPGFWMNP